MEHGKRDSRQQAVRLIGCLEEQRLSLLRRGGELRSCAIHSHEATELNRGRRGANRGTQVSELGMVCGT
jgi:hypothetical protein